MARVDFAAGASCLAPDNAPMKVLSRFQLFVERARRDYKQDPDAMEAFKKNFPARVAEVRTELAPGVDDDDGPVREMPSLTHAVLPKHPESRARRAPT